MTSPEFSNPAALVPPVGPYSHSSRVGCWLHLAGQTGIDRAGQPAGAEIATQAAQALENIRLALRDGGADLDSIVKLTTYVAGEAQLPGMIAYMDEAFPQLFPAGYPPNTLLVVAQLVSAELLVEIEAVAAIPE